MNSYQENIKFIKEMVNYAVDPKVIQNSISLLNQLIYPPEVSMAVYDTNYSEFSEANLIRFEYYGEKEFICVVIYNDYISARYYFSERLYRHELNKISSLATCLNKIYTQI
jgi:hypothetical protein